jgi:hypothetical protein
MDSKLQQEREVNGGTPFAEARGSAVHGEFTHRDGQPRACRVTKREGNVLRVQYIYHGRLRTGYIGVTEFRPAPIDNGVETMPPNAKLTDRRD